MEPGQRAALRSSQLLGGVLRSSQTPTGLISYQKVRTGPLLHLLRKGGLRQEVLLKTLRMERSAQDSRWEEDI